MEGIGYWASKLARGEMTFGEVADEFIASAEFTDLFGTELSHQAFIELLYSNVLDREPDPDGLAYWLGLMEEGLSQRDALLGFSNSDEHIHKIEEENQQELSSAEAVERSQDDSDDKLSDKDALQLLYDAAFNHSADEEGLGYWTKELAKSDVELADIAAFFLASEEFQTLYGTELSDDDFIEALYHNTLGRDSDIAGKAHWFGQLESGMARGELLEIFATSDEHQEDLALTGTNDTNTEILVA